MPYLLAAALVLALATVITVWNVDTQVRRDRDRDCNPLSTPGPRTGR
ncbi:hypothetical protein [Streptomyces sp. NPDC004376]